MHDTGEHGSVTTWLTAITVAQGEADAAWRNLWERLAAVRQAAAGTGRPRAGRTGASALASLEDETLRQVALMWLFPASNEEIAAAIGVCVRSVQHKSRAIAERWQPSSGGEPTS